LTTRIAKLNRVPRRRKKASNAAVSAELSVESG
jgi:hypothetical protein